MNCGKIITKTVRGEEIRCGIVHGNETIVFIMTGAGGDVRGYAETRG